MKFIDIYFNVADPLKHILIVFKIM